MEKTEAPVNLNLKAMEIVTERMSELNQKIASLESLIKSRGHDKGSSVKLFRLKDVLATNEQFYSWLKDAESNRLH